MLKSVLFLAVALSFSAQASCIGEAQILGKVGATRISEIGCRVFVTPETEIKQHVFCPIDLFRVYHHGIEVGQDNNRTCALKAGDDISGIVIDNGDVLFLE